MTYGGGGVGLVVVGGGGRVRMDVKEELKFLSKYKKKYLFFWGGVGLGGGGGGGGRVLGGQGRCEQRSEVFVKIQKKKSFLGGGGQGDNSAKTRNMRRLFIHGAMSKTYRGCLEAIGTYTLEWD